MVICGALGPSMPYHSEWQRHGRPGKVNRDERQGTQRVKFVLISVKAEPVVVWRNPVLLPLDSYTYIAYMPMQHSAAR